MSVWMVGVDHNRADLDARGRILFHKEKDGGSVCRVSKYTWTCRKCDPVDLQQNGMLAEQGVFVQGKTCMVIGNGMMGKLSAQALMEAGAGVTVTVRQYTSGLVDIPKGADRINYKDRYGFLPGCDLVVSATSSPNYTITRSEMDYSKINAICIGKQTEAAAKAFGMQTFVSEKATLASLTDCVVQTAAIKNRS